MDDVSEALEKYKGERLGQPRSKDTGVLIYPVCVLRLVGMNIFICVIYQPQDHAKKWLGAINP